MNNIPVYDKTAAYAAEHNEREAYRASYKANMACKNAVSETIRKNLCPQQFGRGKRA